MTNDYQKVGVDVNAADAWVERIAARLGSAGPADLRARVKSGIGDYGAVFELSPEQWIAVSCDGVGTKLLWTQAELGSVEDLAQDLVAMNANDLLCVGARPGLFLDYLAVGSSRMMKEGGPLARFIDGLSKAAAESNMIVVGGETAQMPDLYGEHGFDLAGFAVGWLKPQEHLTVETMRPGDELWGWSSSGPHSNGFSWLRRLFDSARDANFIREQLMPPTKLYAKSFFELRDKTLNPGDLHGAFHVTGSGVLNFVRSQPKGRTIGFDLKEWGEQPAPVWIQGVAERAGLPRGARVLRDLAVDHDQARTLWTTFNMGYGFAVVLAPELVAREETRLKSSGLVRLGRVIDQPCVRVGDLTLS